MKIKNLLFLSLLFFALIGNDIPIQAQVVELLKDIAVGGSSSGNNFMAECNGKLFISADDGVHGIELWVSDGTESGTQLLKDIKPGSASSEAGWANNFAVCNNKLFFIANDGVHGSELWITDGTETGTMMVKDICPPGSGLGGYGSANQLYTFNGKVYFAGRDNSTSQGGHDVELWCSDGTEAGTYMVKDIRPDESSSPANFCEYNGKLYFEAYDGAQNQGGHSGELWVTDGTEAGTYLLKDIALVQESEVPSQLTVCNGKMFFTTDDGTHGKELWVTDGTETGTHLVKDIIDGETASYPQYLTALDGFLYFSANSGSNINALWKTDGTEQGTVIVSSDIHDPTNIKAYNGKVVFLAYDGNNTLNYELWASDGTAIGTVKVKEINPDPIWGLDFNPGLNFKEGFVEYNNKLYFRASDDGYGIRLWETDGTEAGTMQTPGQILGIPDPLSAMYIEQFTFTVCAGSLYYPAVYDDEVIGIEPYKLTTVPIANVTGGGSYCEGGEGLPVGLSDSDQGVIYTLYKDGIAQSPTMAGTGDSISFGNQLYGTYTVTGTNAAGITVNMNGNAVITEHGLLPVSVTAIPDQNGVCEGTTVTFTANPTNGGTPVYQWYKNGEPVGSNEDTYTFVPQNNDNVYVQMTSSLGCISGNPAMSAITTMSVSTSVIPGVTIASDYDTICGGSTVTYIAEPVNGGVSPTYQWYKNGEPVGANQALYTCVISFVPVIENDYVYVVMTSDLSCAINNPATSSVDTLTILPRPFVEVSIEADNEAVCDGSPVTFTATPVYGGTAPTYYWQVNDNLAGTTNEPTFTYVPAANDYVYVMMHSDLPCAVNNPATSNSIYITVNSPLTPSVSIVASENHVSVGTPVTFTPTPENGGTPTYQWYVNGNYAGDETPYVYIPEDGDHVYAKMASSLECITSDTVASNTVIMDVITGIGNTEINEFKVYCYNKVVSIENSKGLTGEVSIFDITGCKLITRTLTNEPKTFIPVSFLTSGTYIVRIITNNCQFNTKLLIY